MNIFQKKLAEIAQQHPYVDGVRDFRLGKSTPEYKDPQYVKEWTLGYQDAEWLWNITNGKKF